MACSHLHPSDLVKVKCMLTEECIWNGVLHIQMASLFCTSCLGLHSQLPCQMGAVTGEHKPGGAGNGYSSVLHVVVQCLEMESCKDALRPVSLLGSVSSSCVPDWEARPVRSGAIRCTGDPCCKKTRYMNIQTKMLGLGGGRVIRTIKCGSLFEGSISSYMFVGQKIKTHVIKSLARKQEDRKP